MRKKRIIGILIILFGLFFFILQMISGEGPLDTAETTKKIISVLSGFFVLVLGIYYTIDCFFPRKRENGNLFFSYASLILGVGLLILGVFWEEFLNGYPVFVGIILFFIGLTGVLDPTKDSN